MDAAQQFCLKWNNHHSNLLSVFEALLHTEAFTDVTLAVDGASIKCHKMVLAACSTYFHNLFAEHVASNLIVVLKDVRLCEMRALLEYMYRGEVNVAQEQFSSLLSVAETLQIKGLVEEGRRERERVAAHCTPVDLHQPGGGLEPERTLVEPRHPFPDSRRSPETAPPPPACQLPPPAPPPPPQSPGALAHKQLSPAAAAVGPESPMAAVHPAAAAAAAAAAAEMHKRRRKPQEIWCENNPILRTVLGHGGMSGLDVPTLMAAAMRRDMIDREYADRQVMSSTGSEENHAAPGTPNSEPEVDKMSNGSVGEVAPHWDPNLSASYMNSYINFAPTQMRPEWKRYKQYSKTDLQQALDAVKGGMTALQASRKFHVPSRTLYDKIKKLGIPTMPRRYPRSPGQLASSPLPLYSATAAASIQQQPHAQVDGDDSATSGDLQHQPMELVVDKRHADSAEPPAADFQLKWPLKQELQSEESESRDVQRQPMELVVDKRRASPELDPFQVKWTKEDGEESRELDVVA